MLHAVAPTHLDPLSGAEARLSGTRPVNPIPEFNVQEIWEPGNFFFGTACTGAGRDCKWRPFARPAGCHVRPHAYELRSLECTLLSTEHLSSGLLPCCEAAHTGV